MFLRTKRHLISRYFRNFGNALLLKQQNNLSVVPSYNFEEPCIKNEPLLEYKAGSKELKELEKALDHYQCQCEEIPIVVGGKYLTSKNERKQVMPHNHGQAVAKFYYADEGIIKEAINVAVKAQRDWDATPYDERIKIWEKAADLMKTKYRGQLLASAMLGQSKTVFQAEVDAGAELIDFIRMNAQFCKLLLSYKPISENPSIILNHMLLRGLGGFVAAISPFNFTAIGGNLAYTPALMGNSVLWKPSDTAILSNWLTFKIMKEAGVPDGIVNFIPCDGPTFGNAITSSSDLVGINFTGSVPTFKTLWKYISDKLDCYKSFPRVSGECGGKNYHFIHPSADVEVAIACTIRGAFEYGGQKCSATSRLYIPESLWKIAEEPLCRKTCDLILGDVRDYKTFYSAVIDKAAFKRITAYIEYAQKNSNCTILTGGDYDDKYGYFIDPTIILVKDPQDKLFKEEIFGPVLAVYVYKDNEIDKTIELLRTVNPFALTGAVFATDENFLKKYLNDFRTTAGNFYINDKSTGAVVGQQPFGGGKLSGTNDKPGCPYYLMRWTSPIAIKETFVPQTDIYYPYMNIK